MRSGRSCRELIFPVLYGIEKGEQRKMEIYLDNSATTRCFDEVRAYMEDLNDRVYGNSSSLHNMGAAAEMEIRKAREIIAGCLKVKEKNIIFTSGGTESDNLAIFGTALLPGNIRKGRHIISTKIEHPAVRMPLKELSENGYEVTLLDVDKYGRISLDELSEALTEETILVSIMHTNNEIGALEPLKEAGELIKKKSPGAYFHVDAIQGFGKARIYPERMGIDLLSASSHKLHGPKGAGFLYIGDNIRLKPLILGGGHQRGMRSGTENVPGVGGMAKAAELLYRDLEADIERLYELKTFFVSEVLKTEGVACVNGIPFSAEAPDMEELERAVRQSAPHIVSVSFESVRAEVMLHALEEKGIFVSAGSACSSNKPAVSETLKAIGLSNKYLDKTIRLSFSKETTKEELSYTLSALKELLSSLGKFVRR